MRIPPDFMHRLRHAHRTADTVEVPKSLMEIRFWLTRSSFLARKPLHLELQGAPGPLSYERQTRYRPAWHGNKNSEVKHAEYCMAIFLKRLPTREGQGRHAKWSRLCVVEPDGLVFWASNTPLS